MKHRLVGFSTILRPPFAIEPQWLGTSRFNLEESAPGRNGSNNYKYFAGDAFILSQMKCY